MPSDYLKLNKQLCFPIYATSRMITRLYQPLLDKLQLTYPQYLVLLVLWEQKNLTVSSIGEKLFLNSNTLTPLIKKMVEKGLLKKERSTTDERTVHINLTEKGKELQHEAQNIPLELANNLNMPLDELETMHQLMWKFLGSFEHHV